MSLRLPKSLHGRLALSVGIGVATLWVITALITASIIRHEINEVFDSALEETGQRILPLAIKEFLEREDDGTEQLITTLREHDEFLTYVVRDASRRVLLRSHDTDLEDFPPIKNTGFMETSKHRIYYDTALGGDFSIAIAEPLDHRSKVARETLMALGFPLLFLLPLMLAGIWVLVSLMLRPLRGFATEVATRDGHNLTQVIVGGLPEEIVPVGEAVNQLLDRLQRTLDAERSFAANAAHELRTPVAAALAQTQRLLVETGEETTGQRAKDIEASLKRLNRLSEKLMQMARAEGANLRTQTQHDLSLVLRMVTEDLEYSEAGKRMNLEVPDHPVMSNIDPDAFAILVRNLLENALRHGELGGPVSVSLKADGTLRVANRGPVVSPEVLGELTQRFARGQTPAKGSGLGLAIVQAIAHGTGAELEVCSPETNCRDGFEVVVHPSKT